MVMMNSSVTDPPAPTGSSVNSLVRTGALLTKSVSVAVFPTTGEPPMSIEIADVVLV